MERYQTQELARELCASYHICFRPVRRSRFDSIEIDISDSYEDRAPKRIHVKRRFGRIVRIKWTQIKSMLRIKITSIYVSTSNWKVYSWYFADAPYWTTNSWKCTPVHNFVLPQPSSALRPTSYLESGWSALQFKNYINPAVTQHPIHFSNKTSNSKNGNQL